MTKAAEYREMNSDQLAFALKETQQELFRLRFQAATEKIDAPSSLKRLRRDIARIRTIQRQRELAVAAETE
ncbi:MAG: 50S ribosomal protein L29 [Planctomycetaceae bacterium]|nr:50S ribosomal protein L29 [Planctomycetaceae bacterium]